MQINILEAMQECFDFLQEKQKDYNSLYFVPRRINNQRRLEKGYFFIGNDNYMQISFWDGRDWKQRTHNIAFVVDNTGKVFIEFSATDEVEHKNYLTGLAEYFEDSTGIKPTIKDYGKWFFEYKNISQKTNINDKHDYLDCLNHFIEHHKSIIDEYLNTHNSWIQFLDEEFNSKYVIPLKEMYPQAHSIPELKELEEDSESAVFEGKKKLIYTYIYERNAKNRNQAITLCKKLNNGRVMCAVCGFDFGEIYGEVGKHFIEVHHNKPLYKNNGIEVKINPKTDLDCVCSNCHRMLHKLNVAPTIENLRKVINSNKLLNSKKTQNVQL